MTLTMYGATHCEDTERTRIYLQRRGIPFRDINIDHDLDAERFVIFINDGNRDTPTLVLGSGRFKSILTEPSDEELEEVLKNQ